MADGPDTHRSAGRNACEAQTRAGQRRRQKQSGEAERLWGCEADRLWAAREKLCSIRDRQAMEGCHLQAEGQPALAQRTKAVHAEAVRRHQQVLRPLHRQLLLHQLCGGRSAVDSST